MSQVVFEDLYRHPAVLDLVVGPAEFGAGLGQLYVGSGQHADCQQAEHYGDHELDQGKAP